MKSLLYLVTICKNQGLVVGYYNPGKNKWIKHRSFINFLYQPPSPLPLNSMLVLNGFFFQNLPHFNIEIGGRWVEIKKFVKFCRVPIHFVRDCRISVSILFLPFLKCKYQRQLFLRLHGISLLYIIRNHLLFCYA